jgi:Zn-dependent protease with chaperone function
MASTLTYDTLVFRKEKTYFNVLRVLAILLWIAIAVTLVGLLYAAVAGVVIWCLNGLLVSRLKSEAVRVNKEQLPELYASYQAVCAALGQREEPEFYLLQSHGVLNAFATRHAGRNFVVIYSSLLEALGHDTAEVRFLIGHEIGHIQRSHLPKRLLLLPALVIPLLGAAYHRACETTCDRFGALAAGNGESSVRAMLALAAGKEAAPRVNPSEFARQYYQHRGFFVSWHELISGYPTLSRRVGNLLALEDGTFGRTADRNPFAYPCAFFGNTPMMLVMIYGLFLFFFFKQIKKTQAMQAQNVARARQMQWQAASRTPMIVNPPAVHPRHSLFLPPAPYSVPAPALAPSVATPEAPAAPAVSAPAPAAAPATEAVPSESTPPAVAPQTEPAVSNAVAPVSSAP